MNLGKQLAIPLTSFLDEGVPLCLLTVQRRPEYCLNLFPTLGVILLFKVLE